MYNDLVSQGLVTNAQGSEGLPVGIQVIGLPYEEERVLGMMAKLEQKIKFYQNNPLPV